MTLCLPTDQTEILQNTRDAAQKLLLPKVRAIDEGYYPRDELGQIAKTGAFSAHLKEAGSRFDTAILATAQIGRVCGTSAFLAWCHQVMGLYLDHAPNTAPKQALLAAHANGERFGGTALSNPMKSWANIEPMILQAKKDGDGFVISGTLPWISHIGEGQYCGAVAQVDGGEQVFFVLEFDDARHANWALEECPDFSGMMGSATWRIVLNNYKVSQSQVLAYPCTDFIKNIRAAFVLMQMGIGAGIIQGAIDDIGEGTAKSNAFLEDQAGNLQSALDRLVQKTLDLAKTAFETDVDFFIDVLNVRQQGAILALKATQAALLHQGARGYVMSASPQRRLREAQFIAIVTPAIKHLRYLTHQLMQNR